MEAAIGLAQRQQRAVRIGGLLDGAVRCQARGGIGGAFDPAGIIGGGPLFRLDIGEDRRIGFRIAPRQQQEGDKGEVAVESGHGGSIPHPLANRIPAPARIRPHVVQISA